MVVWRPHERRALALSFGYFALLLASYYLIRPVRDAMAAGSGPDTIKYLSSLVFFVMLLVVPIYGLMVSRIRRSRLLPLTHAFFAINLLLFGGWFRLMPDSVLAGRVFYVWTTAFNLFVVSMFWSVMAEVWREEQGRRLFGVIAAGGSLGGLCGPVLARTLAVSMGIDAVLVSAAATLGLTIVTIVALERCARRQGDLNPHLRLNEPVGGEILAGLTRLLSSPFLLGMASLVMLGAIVGMFVYIELARSAAMLFHSAAERTAFFAARDLWVNVASFVVQLVVVGSLTQRFGVQRTLVGGALITTAVFSMLAVFPGAWMLLWANSGLRVLEFGIAKPARDMLWTVVDRDAKYKAKNVIDTVVYRGSDVLGGWLHAGLTALGLSLGGIAAAAAGVGGLLIGGAYATGRAYRRRGGD